jgi:hypothetical protein
MDGWMDGWMGGWVGGCVDRQTDRQTDRYAKPAVLVKTLLVQICHEFPVQNCLNHEMMFSYCFVTCGIGKMKVKQEGLELNGAVALWSTFVMLIHWERTQRQRKTKIPC